MPQRALFSCVWDCVRFDFVGLGLRPSFYILHFGRIFTPARPHSPSAFSIQLWGTASGLEVQTLKPRKSAFLRFFLRMLCVVGFYGAGLNDDGGVAVLDRLTTRRDCPRDVTTHHHHTRQNDCHNYYFFHIFHSFIH